VENKQKIVKQYPSTVSEYQIQKGLEPAAMNEESICATPL